MQWRSFIVEAAPLRPFFADFETHNMNLLAAITVSLLLATGGVLAVPQADTPTPTSPILPPEPSATCSCPGPILCCSGIVKSTSDEGQKVLEELGVGIKGVTIPVGVQCRPHYPCPPGWACVSIRPLKCFASPEFLLMQSCFNATASHYLHKSNMLLRIVEL